MNGRPANDGALARPRLLRLDQPHRARHLPALPRLLNHVLFGARDLQAAIAEGTATLSRDPSVLQQLVGLLAPVDPAFAIVTP